MTDYLAAVERGVVVYDGGAGTTLHAAGLTVDDFDGPDLDGCAEVLNVTRPDVVERLHRSFLDVGVDAVETNTFGGFAIPLAEYGIAERAYELNAAGASIARSVVDEYVARDGRRRFVAGSVGPGTKLATLGQTTYRELRDAYAIQAAGLIDGGVDLFIIETQYDLLGAKAAINGVRRAMHSARVELPLQVQVTIETNGRMLVGTDIAAALTTLDGMRPDVVGLNCATGPAEMYGAVRHLSERSRMPIAVIPNAGLPSIVDDEVSYDLAAAELAAHLGRFVSDYGVRVVGGCCGTTPEHLAAVVETVRALTPAERVVEHVPSVASVYGAVPIHQDTSFLIVGERTNANGSRAFRDAMLDGDIDQCVEIGRSQVAESAHLLDLCVDYVGRDGVPDMASLAARIGLEAAVPIVLDSTEPEVMRAGLERLAGRSILNSLNLEDGSGPGSRARRVLDLAVEHGAAVVCLLIDEDGQARDVDWKLRVAGRIYDLAVDEYGLEPDDLIFDPLTFPLSTGDDDLRRDAMHTIEALRRLKEAFPGTATVLGISNVSFGLRPAARRALNSVFLHECLDAGLDAAIIHAGRIEPLHLIDPDQRRICEDLIYDRRTPGYDPLEALLDAFGSGGDTVVVPEDQRTGWSVERRLEQRIIDGERSGLEEVLDEGLAAGHTPLGLVNDVLLSGMRTVGELFASGDMQLPFVLRSAETMKAAVTYLEPLMAHTETASRGSVVLATVAGDVHDIGKNLVDIILSNNGFTVHNLGIKVGVSELIDAYEQTGADAIGMSGLLVKSTLVMRDNLDELTRRGHGAVPVLLGGAALNRAFVERDLRRRYDGPLYYGKNAFSGLDAMQRIAAGEAPPPVVEAPVSRTKGALDATVIPERSPSVATDEHIFVPPFTGSRVVTGIDLDGTARYLNETALFRNQWQYRPGDGETDGEFRERLRPRLAEQLSAAAHLLDPQVVYGYYPVNADGDDLIVWTDETRSAELTRFRFPRQRNDPWLCIADFFRPVADDRCDYAAFHVVTMGARVSERTAELFAADRYHDYLLLHGIGVEMTEALAERWHRHIRVEWGFGDEDGPTVGGLFRQRYRGGRYSWGYPACPDLEDNQRVADLLDAGRIGVVVGADTGYQYQPEQTTSALIAHHPQAKYFVARSAKETRDAYER